MASNRQQDDETYFDPKALTRRAWPALLVVPDIFRNPEWTESIEKSSDIAEHGTARVMYPMTRALDVLVDAIGEVSHSGDSVEECARRIVELANAMKKLLEAKEAVRAELIDMLSMHLPKAFSDPEAELQNAFKASGIANTAKVDEFLRDRSPDLSTLLRDVDIDLRLDWWMFSRLV